MSPLTPTGTFAFVTVLLPSWPEPFNPQHVAVPPVNNAHEWLPPVAIFGGAAATLAPAGGAAVAGIADGNITATMAITGTIAARDRSPRGPRRRCNI